MSGKKDVLGMYVGENESAKFWLSDVYKRQVISKIFAVVTGKNNNGIVI